METCKFSHHDGISNFPCMVNTYSLPIKRLNYHLHIKLNSKDQPRNHSHSIPINMACKYFNCIKFNWLGRICRVLCSQTYKCTSKMIFSLGFFIKTFFLSTFAETSLVYCIIYINDIFPIIITTDP